MTVRVPAELVAVPRALVATQRYWSPVWEVEVPWTERVEVVVPWKEPAVSDKVDHEVPPAAIRCQA